MTDTDQKTPRQIRRRHVRRHIPMPGGKTLIPRAEFADILGEDERTTRRRNPPTIYIGGVAYVEREGSFQIIAAGVKRANQSASPKRRATRGRA